MNSVKSYRLKAPDALHPLWMQSFRGPAQEGVIDANGSVTVQGVSLDFAAPGSELPVGTSVKVWVDHQFLCAESAELERYEVERKESVARLALAEQERKSRSAAEDLQFNEDLNVPVKWRIGIKDVLSGLSESSDGSGRNRASVNHILLLERLEDGRLRRLPGDVLCTSRSQSNGKNWSGQREEARGRVTCTRCLQLAEKWVRPALT